MASPISPGCLACAESWKESAERDLATAQALAATGKDWPGVYWHAGFAVEQILKAVVVKVEGLMAWPVQRSGADWHNLSKIANYAQLPSHLRTAFAADANFGAYWLTVKDWDQRKRYPGHHPTSDEAKELLRAISNPTSGVMRWLQRHYQSI
jgi:HEPN domain-containing protein